MSTYVEQVPGGDRIAKKLNRMHVSKRSARCILDLIEAQAGDEQHAIELARALSDDTTIVPEATRESLKRLLISECVTEVMTIKRSTSRASRMACFSRA